MASSTTQITSLTTDYDAIEHAIRETSRGRWFLNCYLERNRSAETKMLMAAIAKLESAMRDNGLQMQDTASRSLLPVLRDAIDEARCDMARMPQVESSNLEKPMDALDFESIPASGAAELRVIRDAASSIHSAAYALHAAGIFQGVAEQIAEGAQLIEDSCAAQEAVLLRASRMASLVCELESELISACEDHGIRQDAFVSPTQNAWLSSSTEHAGDNTIPDEVVEELSVALAECYANDGFDGPNGLNS